MKERLKGERLREEGDLKVKGKNLRRDLRKIQIESQSLFFMPVDEKERGFSIFSM